MNTTKGLVIGLILAGILALVLFLIIDTSINNQNLTGRVVTQITQSSDQLTEQVIIDNEQQINENSYYPQTFEISKSGKVLVGLTGDELFNYALLPDYELEHYTKGESFKSYANKEGIVYLQETYDLNAGKYSVVIRSLDKPVNIHLIVKAINS